MRILGAINIDFESSVINEELLKQFEKKMFEFMQNVIFDGIYDIASEVGFNVDSLNPAYIYDDFEILRK